MIQGKCPVCSKPYAIAALADLPTFPFCSERCRLVDLGRWIDGAYVIPGPEIPARPPRSNGDVGEDEG
jgi:endogenous inhibitor of DNA gyrase (YacG/DUF329 family)